MSFTQFDLDPRLQQGVQALGFIQPTPIQVAAIPVALTGRDIMGSAETGTGKTAAFLLPLMQRLLEGSGSGRNPRSLILVPTRELALQVADHARSLSVRTRLRTVTVYGGVSLVNQQQALARGADIVIATPGRLLDHAARRNIDFSSIEVLVLDEADRMLDVGFLPDLRRIVRMLPKKRQTMLFSATLRAIRSLSAEVAHDAAQVEVATAAAPEAIAQTLLQVPEHLKLQAVQQLLVDEQMDSVLIFTRTKHRADRLVKNLQRAGVLASVIHGNRSQGQRVAALEAFRHGHVRVLVATDIAARGIDVEGISHVINYDVPNQASDYVHRIGRTGRAEAVGTAYTLVTTADMLMIRKIEGILKQRLPRRMLDGVDYSRPALVEPDPESIRRYVEANRRRPQPRAGARR